MHWVKIIKEKSFELQGAVAAFHRDSLFASDIALNFKLAHRSAKSFQRLRNLTRAVRRGYDSAGTTHDVDAIGKQGDAQAIDQGRVSRSLYPLEAECGRIECHRVYR